MEEVKYCSECKYWETDDNEEPCIACKRGISPSDPKYETAEVKWVSKFKQNIKDSGNRREFKTGAVRDIQDGKGRCDLMPLDIVNQYLNLAIGNERVLNHVQTFIETGEICNLYLALNVFCDKHEWDTPTMFLELAKHFEEGAKKYGENNWQKGLPVNCYIDSAVRHYLKWLRGDNDEPHDRAFVWNIVCCAWTVKHNKEGDKE